jgi:thiol-disulfide isomerase/thioredoxin
VLVEGQITNHVGAGHAGVRVFLRTRKQDGTPGDVLATTETDEYGDFTLTSPEPRKGQFFVTCTAKSFEELAREVHVGLKVHPPFVAATLQGKLTMRGVVRDGVKGLPIAGAKIVLKAFYREWVATAGDDGRFEIRGVLPGKGELIVEAEGFGREVKPVPELAGVDEIAIDLKPQRVVRLKAIDENGMGVGGASVECWDRQRDDLRHGVTGPDGVLTLRGLHFDARKLVVRLMHEAFVSGAGFDRNVETPGDQAESEHELVMQAAGRIEGIVTGAADGAPLNGARITVGVELRDDAPRDWSNYEGKFSISSVPPGRAVATVHLSGFAPGLTEVDVTAGRTARVEFVLREGRALSGTCRNEAGEPVGGVFVEATGWRGYKTLGLRAVTAEDGAFLMDHAPSDEFEVAASVPGGEPLTRNVRADETDLSFVLPISAITAQVDPRVKTGEDAPSTKLTFLDGKSVALADLRGKVVLLDFWATWCAPCIVELPHLIALHEKFGPRKDFLMIGVSLDSDETELRDFLKERKIEWPQCVGDNGGATAKAFGVTGIPAVFLIGVDGKILAVNLFGAELTAKVNEVLSERDPT